MRIIKKHGLRKHRLYQIWQSMIQRCTNPACPRYASYGSRGITVCNSWVESIVNFLADMESTWREGLQLDRIDNNKGYTPANCRWVSSRENNFNRRDNVLTKEQADKAIASGIPAQTVRKRLREGWSMGDATTRTPRRCKQSGFTARQKRTAAQNGITVKDLHNRVMRMGWDTNKAISTPVKRRKLTSKAK